MSDKEMVTREVQDVENVERNRPVHWAKPQVDIYETADELVLLADLPGVQDDALQLEVERGLLTLEAAAGSLEEPSVYGFYRQFRISERIDAAAGTAALKDGVLTLKLPKSEAAKPKRIEVKTLH